MIVYGMNVLKSVEPKKIKKVTTSRNEVIEYCRINKIKYEYQDNHFLNKITKENHQGVIIDIYDYNYYEMKDIDGDFVLILDHLEDPHNFGAIIRTCAAAGIKSIIIPKDRSVKVTDVVVKTSVGMIENVKIILVNNIQNAINKLKDMGYFVYAADMDGENYKKVDYALKKVLIIGNEGDGISRLTRENSDVIVSIPIEDNVESLNASVAAGIIIYRMLD